jgi:hypothetical protein
MSDKRRLTPQELERLNRLPSSIAPDKITYFGRPAKYAFLPLYEIDPSLIVAISVKKDYR